MQVYSEKEDTEEDSLNSNSKIKQLIKFYLLPGWRNPEFSKREYEIGKIKSKRFQENGIQMEKYQAEFQFYRVENGENYLKKFR